MINAAIRYEPEGYSLDGSAIMGRQAAGNAFLRAAVQGLAGQPLWAYTASQPSAQHFADTVKRIDAGAHPRWIAPDQPAALAEVGTLYLPDPSLAQAAHLRLRAGVQAYSITGITHTTASHVAMDMITALLDAPVMPWDALICTSSAVVETVQTLLNARLDYLRWRFGKDIPVTLPQFPLIPLGVHTADFDATLAQRLAARAALGLADDEILLLFVGRLSFHAKAHPHAMLQVLDAVAQATGKRITLLQCGWFANAAIESTYRDAGERFSPHVRMLYSDGRDAAQRDAAWAAADVFISLADNIQETFGLTPIEAMAAGLPVLVTDWDGYRDTVRDGVDGFRVPTWMPPPGLGSGLARAFEAGAINYDHYCGLTGHAVSIDMAVLAERLTALANDAELRRRMGEAGRARAREAFDWRVIFARYLALWQDLAERRKEGQGVARWQGAPTEHAARMDPFLAFAHYPTFRIGMQTLVGRAPDASVDGWRSLAGHALFAFARPRMPTEEAVGRILAALTQGRMSVETLAHALQAEPVPLIQVLASLAKMGLIRLETPPAP